MCERRRGRGRGAREGACTGAYYATAHDIEVDPQRRRFGCLLLLLLCSYLLLIRGIGTGVLSAENACLCSQFCSCYFFSVTSAPSPRVEASPRLEQRHACQVVRTMRHKVPACSFKLMVSRASRTSSALCAWRGCSLRFARCTGPLSARTSASERCDILA